MCFADYIYDHYITGGWRTLWNQAMGLIGHSGDTLVEIVNGFIGFVGDGLSAIKSIVGAVYNGIKAGVQFIANTVLGLIVDGIVLIIRNLIQVIASLTNAINSNLVTISMTSNGASFNGEPFEIYKNGLSVIMRISSLEIILSNLFLSPEIEVEQIEALSLNPVPFQRLNFVSKMGILLALLNSTNPYSGLVALASVLSMLLNAEYELFKINTGSYDNEDKINYLYQLRNYHIGASLGHFASVVLEIITPDMKFIYRAGILLGFDVLIDQLFNTFENELGPTSNDFTNGLFGALVEELFGEIGDESSQKNQAIMDFVYIGFHLYRALIYDSVINTLSET